MVDNLPMNLQRDRRRSLRNSIHNPSDSSGHQGGRARMVDLSETGSYVHITFRNVRGVEEALQARGHD